MANLRLTPLRLSGLSLVLTMGFAMPHASASKYTVPPEVKAEQKAKMAAATKIFRAGLRKSPTLMAAHTGRLVVAAVKAAGMGTVSGGMGLVFVGIPAALVTGNKYIAPATGIATGVASAVGWYNLAAKPDARDATIDQAAKKGIFTVAERRQMEASGILPNRGTVHMDFSEPVLPQGVSYHLPFAKQ